MNIQSTDAEAFLSIKQIVQRVGVCRRTIEREIQRGKFAAPLKVGNASRWSSRDVENYIRLLEKGREANAESRADTRAFRNDCEFLKRERDRIISQGKFLEEQQKRIALERQKFAEMNPQYVEDARARAVWDARAAEIDRRLAIQRERRLAAGNPPSV